MSIKFVIPSNHLILCCPLLLPSIFPSIRVFSNELVLCIKWPKYWSFSFIISPSNEYSGLIFFRIDWFDLLAVPGTLKNLLQHHSSFKEQASFNFMVAVTICSDFGAPKNKVCHCCHCFPIYLLWSDGTRCHDLCFLNLDFKPAFSLFSFTFIKRLFSSSSLSAIRVVSSAYLRLLIFLLAILIPAYAYSSPAFCMMYSA